MATMNEEMYSSSNAKKALNKYSKRLNMIEGVLKKAGKPAMSYERKLATAVTLDNTAKQIKIMEDMNGAATQPSSIGQYKRYAMDMVGTVIPSLIAPDVVSVQALDNRVGMINILEYQYGSDKGSAKAGQTFASPLAYQGMNPYYTTSSVDGETLSEGATKLAYTGVKPDTLRVYSPEGNELEVECDEEGNLTGDIPEGSKAFYLYDNETVPVSSPTMTMNITSIPIETRSRKLSAVWSFDAQYEMNKEYGQDIQTLLTTQATAEIDQEIDNEITLDLYRVANAGPEVTWSRTAPVGVNVMDHYDSFWNKVVEGSNEIFDATRRCRANFMICGLGVDAVLKCMRNFQANEDMTAIGPHFVGTLGGNIKCYVNPNYDADTFVLGYKGTTMMDAGYVYAPYMPIMTTGMLTLADDFASREGWATMYGKKVINPRLYIKGRIIN